jgi:mono/diheme cytochrome c family protein
MHGPPNFENLALHHEPADAPDPRVIIGRDAGSLPEFMNSLNVSLSYRSVDGKFMIIAARSMRQGKTQSKLTLRRIFASICRVKFLLFFWILVPVEFTMRAEATAKINPQAMVILKGNCFGCHNEEKKKGGLLLTSRKNLLKGSENGPVLISGKPDQSKLIQVLAADSDPHMPPKKQLGEKQIETLRRWIENGAEWDETALAAFGTETPFEKLGSLPADYDPVLAVALSPDGKRLAAARGNEIVLYETGGTNRAPIAEVHEHRDAVQSVAWSRDGKRVASGSYREILVWNSESWKKEQRLTNELIGRITGLAFSPDGTLLCGADGTVTRSGIVRLWETAGWKLAASWEAHRTRSWLSTSATTESSLPRPVLTSW